MQRTLVCVRQKKQDVDGMESTKMEATEQDIILKGNKKDDSTKNTRKRINNLHKSWKTMNIRVLNSNTKINKQVCNRTSCYKNTTCTTPHNQLFNNRKYVMKNHKPGKNKNR